MCVRTTVNLPDDLLRAAKQAAVASGRTFTKVLEDALRAALSSPSATRRGPVRLPTSPGRPRPGVDLDDSAALLELMERTD
ncbi:MAG: DUF2191 domain-containing protein [Actinomycetota bacterium]|nr:DUF2191 domain-containing protein [Actinomycetota bacterium]